jgi:hypothetical protein
VVFGLAVMSVNLFDYLFYDKQPSPFSIGLGFGAGIVFFVERLIITFIEERIHG